MRIALPADVRQAFGGKAFLIAPLGTSDLSEADRRKGEHVSRFKRQIAQVRDTGDPVLKEASLHRRWEEERRAENPNDPEDDAAAEAQILEISEMVFEEHGNAAAQTFYEIASGRATPINESLEDWLRVVGGFIESTASQHRRAIRTLIQWCKRAHVKPFLRGHRQSWLGSSPTSACMCAIPIARPQ